MIWGVFPLFSETPIYLCWISECDKLFNPPLKNTNIFTFKFPSLNAEQYQPKTFSKCPIVNTPIDKGLYKGFHFFLGWMTIPFIRTGWPKHILNFGEQKLRLRAAVLAVIVWSGLPFVLFTRDNVKETSIHWCRQFFLGLKFFDTLQKKRTWWWKILSF